MPHDVTVRGSNFPTAEALEQINALVEKLAKSKAIPTWVQNTEQLLMCVLAGREAGIGPMEALNSYFLVNGKFTMYGSAVIAQLKRHGYKLRWSDCTDQSATVTLVSPDGDEHTETYTMKEAVLAGNASTNPVWKKYPKRMLQWKAVGGAIRLFCPEVLNSAYVREEMDGNAAPTEAGDIIDATATETITE